MQRNQVTFASIAVSLMLAGCVPVVIPQDAAQPLRDQPALANCPVPARSATDVPQVVALMNAERARAGLAPLILSAKISAVAQAFACENAARGSITHTGTDGSNLTERLRRGGVAASMVSENTAALYGTPAGAVAAWMASPPHRANILRPNARAVGVGQADGTRAAWVVDFTS